jgi:STE24 endopeptidase
VEAPPRIRVLVPVLLAAASAEASARLLTPRAHREPGPAVDPGSYFSRAEIRRGARYERPQRRIAAARVGVEAAVLGALVLRARRAGAPPDAPAGEPPPADGIARVAAEGATLGAGLMLATSLAPLPLTALARRRAIRVGLATQSWRGWAVDVLKELGLGTAFSAAGGAGVLVLTRVSPRGWWAPAAGASVALGAGLATLAPVLLDPVFNTFTALPQGQTRDDVLALARSAGVRIGEVFTVDASRRTTAANAYVTGLGPTRRVVLYDTLLERCDRDEVRVVVAHELAHVRHRDVARGIAFSALVAGPAAFAVQRLSWALAPGQIGEPGALPALLLAAGIVTAPLGLISRRVSRAIERRADDFSLRLSGAGPTRSSRSSASSAFRTSPTCAGPAPSRGWRRRTPRLWSESRRPSRTGHPTDRHDPPSAADARPLPLRAAAVLRQVLDSLAGLPLRVVVLHRVDQLAHELGRQVDPADDHPGDLLVLDLVIDASERHRELVVRVADVGEVGVVPRHHVRREVDVDVPVGRVRSFHMPVVSHRADRRRRRGQAAPAVRR